MKGRKNTTGRADMREQLIYDCISADATVLMMGNAETEALGMSTSPPAESDASLIYDTASLQRLTSFLSQSRSSEQARALPVTMKRVDGTLLEMIAIAVPGRMKARQVLDVFKAPALDMGQEYRDLAESNEIMWGMIQKASEAIWCIRYERPVDMSLSEDEVVDQIFELPAVWSMCNAAMARAYDLRDENDLNGRNVHFHWPRNPVNEAFIREVISNRFRVDGAISEDFRRDGTRVLMENDVRAHIADGKLHRLWGTLREVKPSTLDVQGERFGHAALAFEILPFPACLLRSDGTLVTENIAWRKAFGLLGQIAARMAFQSALGLQFREVVLPLPLASGGTQHHMVTCRWQTSAGPTHTNSGSTYLAVTAQLIGDAPGTE